MRDETKTTSKHLSQLLPRFLKEVSKSTQKRPDLLLAAWPEVIGEKLAPMTRAVSFEQGILLVKVKNSTLYSLLSQHEKGRLLKGLKERFPHAGIRDLLFRAG
jgi:hypothetical protein